MQGTQPSSNVFGNRVEFAAKELAHRVPAGGAGHAAAAAEELTREDLLAEIAGLDNNEGGGVAAPARPRISGVRLPVDAMSVKDRMISLRHRASDIIKTKMESIKNDDFKRLYEQAKNIHPPPQNELNYLKYKPFARKVSDLRIYESNRMFQERLRPVLHDMNNLASKIIALKRRPARAHAEAAPRKRTARRKTRRGTRRNSRK